MTTRWDYQKDLARLYRERWNTEHRADQTAYRRRYRADHPEETRRQWRQDSRRYRSRIAPNELKERQRLYARRHKLKMAQGDHGQAP